MFKFSSFSFIGFSKKSLFCDVYCIEKGLWSHIVTKVSALECSDLGASPTYLKHVYETLINFLEAFWMKKIRIKTWTNKIFFNCVTTRRYLIGILNPAMKMANLSCHFYKHTRVHLIVNLPIKYGSMKWKCRSILSLLKCNKFNF